MDKQLLFQFLDACGLGVLFSLGPMDAPQSALVGISITPELEDFLIGCSYDQTAPQIVAFVF
jgi:hypothetical protein